MFFNRQVTVNIVLIWRSPTVDGFFLLQVWHNMKQTGLLPYLTENIDNISEILRLQLISSFSLIKKLFEYLCVSFFANVLHNPLFSGQGLMAGCYGNMLFGVECIEGSYPITTAVLEFILNIIEPFFKDSMESELMASFMYILREIFPVFQKWRFYKLKTRELIGKCITESIF